jgi:hypothetical protein
VEVRALIEELSRAHSKTINIAVLGSVTLWVVGFAVIGYDFAARTGNLSWSCLGVMLALLGNTFTMLALASVVLRAIHAEHQITRLHHARRYPHDGMV